MSDKQVVSAAIEAYFAANWTETKVEYPNLKGSDVENPAAADLADGVDDYVKFKVSFGPQQNREVGGRSVQVFGVVEFEARTRKGNGEIVLHDLTDKLIDLFHWQQVVEGVAFQDGKSFAVYGDGDWEAMPCAVEFYFIKS